MEIDVNKENICINKLMCERKELIFAEEDMIVPDSKPDVLNTINLTGNVCIYKKEVMDGKIKIEGCVNTYIMYLPDSKNDTLRGLNANINFSNIIQMSEAKEGMSIACKVNIKDLECKVLNSRKINVKSELEINLRLYSNENVEIINKINNISNIQTLEENYKINSLVGKNSTRVYVKDTLNVDSEDEIMEILKTEVNLVNNDIKISYNKVLAKCEVEVKIMYLTQNGKINITQGIIPAVGFIDMQNVSEDNICDVENDLKNILIRPNSPEEHTIYVEAEIETNCVCYEKKDIKIIKDLYSPSMDLNFSQKKITTLSEKIVKNKNITVTSKTNIEDLANGRLLDAEVMSLINKEEITESKIMYEGELIVNFIFENEEKSVNSKFSKIKFDFSVENPMNSRLVNVRTNYIITNKKFNVKDGGDVECDIEIDFACEFTNNVNMNIIDNIQVEENRILPIDDYDSLTMYFVIPGDTLWSIAKKFRSTMEDISITNGIEDKDKIYVGQKLYIPKFNYINKIEN